VSDDRVGAEVRAGVDLFVENETAIDLNGTMVRLGDLKQSELTPS
jgi:hypothetical protein